MAYAFHNLRGFLRDLRKNLDEGLEESYQLAELLIEVDDLIATESGRHPLLAGAGNSAVQLDLPDLGDGDDGGGDEPPGEPPVLPRSGPVALGGFPGVVTPMVGNARATAAAEAAAASAGPTADVVRTPSDPNRRGRVR